jgi:hypothetical protein
MYLIYVLPSKLAKLFGKPVEMTGMILGMKFNARNSTFYYLIQFSNTRITRWLSLAELDYLKFRDMDKAKELHATVLGLTKIQDDTTNIYKNMQEFKSRK